MKTWKVTFPSSETITPFPGPNELQLASETHRHTLYLSMDGENPDPVPVLVDLMMRLDPSVKLSPLDAHDFFHSHSDVELIDEHASIFDLLSIDVAAERGTA